MGRNTRIKEIIEKRQKIEKQNVIDTERFYKRQYQLEQEYLRTHRRSILDNPGNIAAVKPVKQKAEVKFDFDKNKPMGMWNYPTLSRAKYKMYGYKTDAEGIRRPISWEETLPVGKRVRMEKRPGVIITGCERIVGGAIQK